LLGLGFLLSSKKAESIPSATTNEPVATIADDLVSPIINQPKPMDTKKVVDGVTIEVIKEGSGEPAKAGDKVSMLYTGKLMDGTVFDASSKHGNQPFVFTLGAGMVIKGWDIGVAGMKPGEVRMLTIPAELAYGARAIGSIPANSQLMFEVTYLGLGQ
jgi:FKBP-type peptidyl-prolyl cis-trans isomerase